MRRLMPWMLVSLLALGTAAGAALGVAHKAPSKTPSQWVAALLATTEKAGTARFSYTHVTSSPNADLRGSLSGNGVVNFVTGDAQVTEVDHEISFSSTDNQPLHPVHSTNTLKAIVIGGTVYQADPIPGTGFASEYHVLPFPKLPRAQRGLSLALNADVALDSLRGPNAVASVRDLGPATIDGAATTRYEVTFAPLRVCVPHQPPAVVTQRPSYAWVDGDGRLVQVRSTSYVSGRLPRAQKLPAAFRDFPRGPTTTVATLTFSEFGHPVHVVAPPASAIAPRGESSVGFAIALADGCRSS
jgi:hypothetical protein